uniref:Aha1_N domain-containing protein n=1 Tax=Panagrellus redivivus TaxID=6233 RepID=A0A7E4VE68_PANRE
MAKWGEGDPRWIVEERPDAANCNNWHWVEKNATPWSKPRLTELLTNQSVTKGPIKFDLTEIKKLEGEATANNRKAKLIFLYEWEIEVKFKATVAGEETVYEGHIEIPNLSDENEADEVDTNLTLSTRGPHEADIRQIVNKEVKELVRKQLTVYIRELKEEFSKGLVLPTGPAKPQVITSGKTTIVDKKAFQNEVVGGTSAAKKVEPVSTGPVEVSSFESVDSFKVPPERLFEILTDDGLIKAWTNGSGKFDAKKGGAFDLLGGQITGTVEEISANSAVVLKWRLKKYPAGHFAQVTFTLNDKNDSTDLVLQASNVPKEYLEETREGFSRYYIQSIGRTFGCAAKMF